MVTGKERRNGNAAEFIVVKPLLTSSLPISGKLSFVTVQVCISYVEVFCGTTVFKEHKVISKNKTQLSSVRSSSAVKLLNCAKDEAHSPYQM